MEGDRKTDKQEEIETETKNIDKSERCRCTSKTRREAGVEPSKQVVTGTAETKKENEEPERMIVRKIHSHYYNTSPRTRPVKRELIVMVDGRREAVRTGKRKEREGS